MTVLPDSVTRASAHFEAPSAAVAAPPVGPALDLRTLFQQHYGSVWRLLRRFGVPQAELDDRAQEVFWVAARRLADVQPGREKSFLYGVSIRVAGNAGRERKNFQLSIEDVPDPVDPRPSPEEQLNEQQATDKATARTILEHVGLPAELAVARRRDRDADLWAATPRAPE